MTSLRVQVKLINRPRRLEPALQSSVFGTLLLVRGSIRHTTGMFRSQLAQVILRPQQTTHTLDLIL